MNCRFANPSDANIILEIKRKLIKETDFFITTPCEINYDIDHEISRMNENHNNGGATFVVEEDDICLGFFYLNTGNKIRVSHVANIGMGIQSGFWGMGAGTLLLSYAVSWAKTQGNIEKINLGVLSNNTRALKLYKKAGFVIDGIKKNEVKICEGEYLDDILMSLQIK